MSTRPSAFTVIAALSRLGATAAVLRPDGDLGREARLARVDRVISDPEHADAVSGSTTVRCYVLGGGADDRQLPGDAVDMERIDPDAVDVPSWYRPNPQRAKDIAFILFTGEGSTTKAIRITNRRWAMSALGTASAAALHTGDTVYSTTPLHHSSALLMSIGGAVAGGARFAISLADDTDTFWEEVRRYGATHVSYTWTSLRAVVDAPQHPNEQYHPIRMFIGSGMPRNLWKRVSERFPDAKVLEFYASAAGEAILANLTGQKPGSMGRPLPGTPEVRVAAFDLADRTFTHTSDGFARETLADEVGVLLSRVRPATRATDSVQRDVFAPGDAWRSTGDLFLRDEQGDHWLAGAVADIVDTADGPVLPSGTRFCLSTIEGVDLIVAYGVDDGGAQALVGAVTLRPTARSAPSDLDEAMSRLPVGNGPLRAGGQEHPAHHVAPADLARSRQARRPHPDAHPHRLRPRRPHRPLPQALTRFGPVCRPSRRKTHLESVVLAPASMPVSHPRRALAPGDSVVTPKTTVQEPDMTFTPTDPPAATSSPSSRSAARPGRPPDRRGLRHRPARLRPGRRPAPDRRRPRPGRAGRRHRRALRDAHGMTVSAQPLGHGATLASNGTVLLRTRGIAHIHVDAEQRIARVGAGVKWGELLAATGPLGLTGLAGSNSDPSVVGFCLSGGLSWFGRKHGVAAHSILSVEIVDPQGELRVVTADSDPDLFWAIRGAGGDFGVVTAIEVQLYPADQLYGGRIMWPLEMARPVLRALARSPRTRRTS